MNIIKRKGASPAPFAIRGYEKMIDIWKLSDYDGRIKIEDKNKNEYIGTFCFIDENDDSDFGRPGNVLYLDCSDGEIWGVYEDSIIKIELLD